MKTLLIIMGFILISYINLKAQQADWRPNINKDVRTELAFADTSSKKINKSDTGKNLHSDSCMRGKNRGKCRMKDKFIDNDGDGINDNRCYGKCGDGNGNMKCNGMGLGLKKRKGQQGRRK